MKLPIRRHTISFKHAWDGVCYTVQTQPNFKIHISAALLAILLGIMVSLSHVEWIILLFMILWVLVSEMINTSIEAMVDLLTDQVREQARVAKDVAAGMVLVGALGSIVVGGVLFIPKLLLLIS